MQTYSVEDYVADIRAVVAEETTEAAISERIKPLSKRLEADRMWFQDTHREIDAEQGFGLHLLYEEECTPSAPVGQDSLIA